MTRHRRIVRSVPHVLWTALALACTRTTTRTEPTLERVPRHAPAVAREGTPVFPVPTVKSPADPGQPSPTAALPTLAAPATGYPFQEPLPQRELEKAAPARRAANLTPGACRAELRARQLPVERAARAADGIADPVRIRGALNGVRFVTPGSKSVYGMLDCRLVLVLEELGRVLERHGVVEVRVDNLYRPRARLPGRRARSQHRYGLAVDVTAFKLGDGTVLSMERDWLGTLKSPPCGPESRLVEITPRALALRNLVCDVARAGLFHHLLTPNYDNAHRDHLHLDIKRGETRWIIA